MGALVELPGKVPPQSLEAERAVLGCILIEPSVLPRAIELVQPEDFYKEGHRKIFGAMLRLFERSEPADTLTVAEELRRAEALVAPLDWWAPWQDAAPAQDVGGKRPPDLRVRWKDRSHLPLPRSERS